jgi:D-alanine-D-alanine ligase-like ATP-grasp enzyme
MIFPELTAAQERQIKELTRWTSRALELRDYGRLDLRLTPSGEWVFLEANPNPALVPFERSFSGSWAGIDFDAAVAEITLRALRRKP